jgi:hypothetical protein
MGAYRQATHVDQSGVRHDVLHAVYTMERVAGLCLSRARDYILLSLLWGFVLYLMLTAAE